MKTSTMIVLGLGLAGVAYLLTQNPAGAIASTGGDGQGGTQGGAGGQAGTTGGAGGQSWAAIGAGTQVLNSRKGGGFVVPGTGTIFGTGTGTARAYRSVMNP